MGRLYCEQKKKIIKCSVWNVTLYAAETWTNKSRSDTVKMWVWWRMLKISWIEKVTNEEVLVHATETTSILALTHSQTRGFASQNYRRQNDGQAYSKEEKTKVIA